MSKVYFISDLHLYHTKIHKFAGDYRYGDTWEENVWDIITRWNQRVKKRDVVKILGDVVMGKPSEYSRLEILRELNGTKHLIMGNHDEFPVEEYKKYFASVKAWDRYKGFWLGHVPMHPAELRGRRQIHGHTHQNSLRDDRGELDTRYINVCIECTDGAPVLFEDIVSGKHTGEPIRKWS